LVGALEFPYATPDWLDLAAHAIAATENSSAVVPDAAVDLAGEAVAQRVHCLRWKIEEAQVRLTDANRFLDLPGLSVSLDHATGARAGVGEIVFVHGLEVETSRVVDDQADLVPAFA
jgi:hypothetical protein